MSFDGRPVKPCPGCKQPILNAFWDEDGSYAVQVCERCIANWIPCSVCGRPLEYQFCSCHTTCDACYQYFKAHLGNRVR